MEQYLRHSIAETNRRLRVLKLQYNPVWKTVICSLQIRPGLLPESGWAEYLVKAVVHCNGLWHAHSK